MPANPKAFVKSADTRTAVASSKAELERVLVRYGAHGFSVAQDYQKGDIMVSFLVPDAPVIEACPTPQHQERAK